MKTLIDHARIAYERFCRLDAKVETARSENALLRAELLVALKNRIAELEGQCPK